MMHVSISRLGPRRLVRRFVGARRFGAGILLGVGVVLGAAFAGVACGDDDGSLENEPPLGLPPTPPPTPPTAP
jgi:hypothetical protein